VPKSADDLSGMGRFFSATTFLSAGNITHTPCYGHMIALGVLASVEERNVSPEQIANASRYREMIARTGRFLTFCGGAPTIGARMREDPRERVALQLVRETDAGIIVRGKIGMHTSPPFAEDVYVGSLCGIKIDGHCASFIVPVNASGVTTVCRKIAVRDKNPFVSPLSSRYDELDGQMWLDDVSIPWEHVFLLGESPEPVVRWLIWHHLYGWLSKAEFTLGLALALSQAMGLVKHDQTIEHLVDLAIEVQTVRSCLVACERDPRFTPQGYCVPNHAHLSVGGIAILKARQRMAEILRIVPGSSLVVCPSDKDLAAPEMAEGLEASFGGGGYTALQRSALLQMAWDHVSSALDGRESAFELHASGGIPAWRGRLRRNFERYNELANAVLRQLDMPMPQVDVSSITEVPWAPRRTVTPS
jgi:aromatic ring hydroxylase